MNFRERMFVNIKATSFKIMMIMTVTYGFIFGSMSQIENFFQGTIDIKNFIYSVVATTLAYGLMFLLIIIIVYNSNAIKMLMTLGISHKNLVKCWRDFHIYNVIIGLVASTIMLTLVKLSDSKALSYRFLNVDLNHIELLGFVKLMAVIMIAFIAVMGIINLITQIGNHFGWRWVVNMSILTLAILIWTIPTMVHTMTWGEGYGLYLGIGILTAIVTFGISHQLIKKMEVKR